MKCVFKRFILWKSTIAYHALLLCNSKQFLQALVLHIVRIKNEETRIPRHTVVGKYLEGNPIGEGG